MTREEAINKVQHMILPKETMEILQALAPELTESGDERARKEIIDFIQWAEDRGSVRNDYHQAKRPAVWIDYLERWKEENHDGKKWLTPEELHRIEQLRYEAGFDAGVRSEAEKRKSNFDTHWENGSMVCERKERSWKPTEEEMGVLYKLCYVSAQISDDDDTELTRLYQDLKREYFNGHSFENMFPKTEKEQEPIKMEVHEVGKGTTVCGQDYKCKKDYQAGNCRYIKDAIYHCGRDGYLTDQNGVSWSCTPEWFNEYIQSNTEWAEEEKTRFVSGQFLQCKLSFDGFKEGECYWLEYVGDDMYVGRSDNILNQRFHITPRQLYTLFSQQLEENEKERKSVERNKATINGEPIPTENQSVDIPLAKWGEEDEHRRKDAIYFLESAMKHYADTSEIEKTIAWLEFLPERFNLQSKQEWSKEDENKIERLTFLVSVAEEKEMISPSESIDLRNLIKSLRPQPQKELSLEKAIQWLDDTFYFLDNSSGRGRDCEITTHDFDSLEEMYDSFRKAVIVDSEPHWKPTEEQMGALKEAAEHSFYAGEGAVLRTLYNDLQKRYGTC